MALWIGLIPEAERPKVAAMLAEKITRNDSHYPADKARGSNLKYNEL
jgi:hypothetical protein